MWVQDVWFVLLHFNQRLSLTRNINRAIPAFIIHLDQNLNSKFNVKAKKICIKLFESSFFNANFLKFPKNVAKCFYFIFYTFSVMFYLFFVVLLLQLTTVFVQECNYKLSNDEILENTYLNRFNFILEQNKVTFGVPTQKEWNVLEGMNGDTLEIGIRRIGKEMVVLFGGNKDVIYAK